eukprot:Skav201024  [mRNA]  locus=scaffold3386:15485:16969:+ [translate_table: standard]
MAMRMPADTERKGSCVDHGFCTAEELCAAYDSVLLRIKQEGVLAKLIPDPQGGIFINVPFAGKFVEKDMLLPWLRKELLDCRPDIRFIRIFVTDVQDFYSGSQAQPSDDPNIFIVYSVSGCALGVLVAFRGLEVSWRVQDGRAPLPRAHLTLGCLV